MGCAEAFAGLGMEVFVKEQEVPPIGRIRVTARLAETRTPAVFTGHEERDKAVAQIKRDLSQVFHLSGTRRIFDREGVAVKVMISLKRLDDEIVGWKPDGPAPVGIAAEHVGVRLAGRVANFIGMTSVPEDEGVFGMGFRKRADAVSGEEFV